jgi:phosphate transport system protein
MANEVIAGDMRLNLLENRVEEFAIDLLARRQPLARDLRFIATALKLNTELERIGDLAVNVAQRAIDVSAQKKKIVFVDTPRLAERAGSMTKRAIESFVTGDVTKARAVIEEDEIADELRNKITDDMKELFLKKDPTSVDWAVSLILVARHLERICDHATYIAEDVIYLIEARNVKHTHDPK